VKVTLRVAGYLLNSLLIGTRINPAAATWRNSFAVPANAGTTTMFNHPETKNAPVSRGVFASANIC
jgi:hypothetical protein